MAKSKPNVSNNQIITNLTTTWSDDLGHTRSWHTDLIRFSLPGSSPKTSNGEDKGFMTLTANEASYARLAFALWDDLIPKTLQETNGNDARITFAYSSTTTPDGTGSPGTYTTPNVGTKHSDRDIRSEQVWIASGWNTNQSANVNLGSYGLETYIHEIGHSLGLSHPGLYDASNKTGPTYNHDATYSRDTEQYTVMSYFDANSDNSGADWKNAYASTPMIDDILAIQAKYGADMTTRNGATTYGFHSNAGRSVYDFNQNTKPVFTIWDGGGRDTLDASGFKDDQTIDLNAGHYSSIGGLKQNIGIAYNVTIEDAIGGSGNDSLIGNSADNTLTGGNGNDTLNGGKGDDVLIGGKGNDVYCLFDMANGVHDSVREDAGGGTDTILITDVHGRDRTYTLGFAIERGAIVGADASGFALFGNELGNELFDDVGGNELFGQGGNDTLDGGAGMDTLQGGEDDDVYHLYDVTNGAYDKVIETGVSTGDMVLVKDLHGKVRSYTLTANVEKGAIVGRDASQFSLHGNGLSNSLFDDVGNNSLFGEGGNDTLDGGAGDDVLEGGSGTDRLIGGGGNDTYHLFDVSNGAYDTVVENGGGNDIVLVKDLHGSVRSYTMTANVERGAIVGHDASGFSLHGNSLNNLLFDDIGNNSLYGEGGDDTLNGGAGQDFLFGGTGNDTYQLQDRGSGGAYDFVVEDAGGGDQDTVEVTAIHINGITDSYILSSNVEIGKLLGTIDFNLFGNASNNILYGNSANNRLYGNSGDDTLIGGGGRDTLSGGYDNDTYIVTDSRTVIIERVGEGVDLVQTHLASYTLADNVENLTFTELTGSVRAFTGNGNALDNAIRGGRIGDQLSGNDGNDYLYGYAGADKLFGGAGNDTLRGGIGDDQLNGGAGVDTADYHDMTSKTDINLETGIGKVLKSTGTETDTLISIENVIGGSNNDNVTGDGGDNAFIYQGWYGALSSSGGKDTFDGGGGHDTVDFAGFSVQLMTIDLNDGTAIGEYSVDSGTGTKNGSKTVVTFSHVENIVASRGDDTIIGDTGDNVFYNAGSFRYQHEIGGIDHYTGGGGNDTVDFSRYDGILDIDLDRGDAQASFNVSIQGGGEADASIVAYLSGIENVVGSLDSDAISGDAQDNVFSYAGSFTIAGFSGGYDNYDGRGGSNTIDMSKFQGTTDIDLASGVVTSSYDFGSGDGGGTASRQIVTLTNIQNAIGSALADTIEGSDGDNKMNGGRGDDRLTGNGGIDHLTGGAGADTFVFDAAGFGNDVITDFVTATGHGSVHDVIEFSTSIFADWDHVLAALSDTEDGAYIKFDDDNGITLNGVTKQSLSDHHESDFAFV